MGARQLEIEPATIAAVKRTDKGTLVVIDDDVQNVARDLQEIDKGFRLAYDPDQDYYVLRWQGLMPDGSFEEHIVTTARQCDQRLVHRVREISAPGYDYGAELEKVEAAARRARDHEYSEQIGEAGERLRHALRRDLGLDRDRIAVPRGEG